MPVFALLTAVIASGCHPSEPPRGTYILDSGSATPPARVSQLGQPVVEVKLARLPDYLDTTDILIRRPDGRVLASVTGRWGERLSVGVTNAVAHALARQLPYVAVTTAPAEDTPWRQVLIDIDSFGAQPDGTCVAIAEWSVRTGRGGRIVDKQRATLVVPLDSESDAHVVAAMSGEAASLAGYIAPGLAPDPPSVASARGGPTPSVPTSAQASR